MVEVSALDIAYQGTTILSDVSFQIRPGEFVYLIGKTGSGKTSLLKAMYGDLKISTGQVFVNDQALHGIKRKSLPAFRRGLGIVFQDLELLNDRSIKENFLFFMKAIGLRDEEEITQKAQQLLQKVGLENHLEKMPHQLSGGEQQRAVIARSLINEPSVIFADEPTGGLDPVVSKEIHQLFVKLHQDGTTVVLATHNHSFLKYYPSRVLLCDQGVVKDMSKEEVLRKLAY